MKDGARAIGQGAASIARVFQIHEILSYAKLLKPRYRSFSGAARSSVEADVLNCLRHSRELTRVCLPKLTHCLVPALCCQGCKIASFVGFGARQNMRERALRPDF